MRISRCMVLLVSLIGIAAFAVDLDAPGMQALKQAYEGEAREVEIARVERLGGLLRETLAGAEDMQSQRTAAGNIAGMAAARTAIRILNDCLDTLDETGDFAIPETVRHEIRPMIDALRDGKSAMDGERDAAVKALRAEYARRLGEQMVEQGATPPPPEELAGLFDALLSAAKPIAEPERGHAPDEATAEDERPPPGAVETAPVELAASGRGTNWVAFSDWHAETYGLEMIRIPVFDRREPEEAEGGGFISGQPYTARYEPIRVLPPGDLYVFRVSRLPGLAGADVVEWPGRHNDWQLMVRIRAGDEVPSRHGLRLEVGGPGADRLPIPGADTARPDPAAPVGDVQVTFLTRPEGALVYVDRKLVRVDDEPVRTPCTIALRAGRNHVVLRRRGYLDAVFAELEASEALRVTWSFKENPAYEEKQVRVSARTVWQSSGVEVKEGDRLLIRAEGQWHCGRKREPIDADGYPNDRNFFHYYADPASSPRQLASANYGALLMRIGEDGSPIRIGTGRRVTAETSGMLYFDVNESVDARFRRDNGGMLTVEIQKHAAP